MRLSAAFVHPPPKAGSFQSELGVCPEASGKTIPPAVSVAPGRASPRQSWISQAVEEGPVRSVIWDLHYPIVEDGSVSPKNGDYMDESVSVRKGVSIAGGPCTAAGEIARFARAATVTLDREAFGPTVNGETSLFMRQPPKGMSPWVEKMMFFCAVWPTSCASSSRQWPYTAYRVAVLSSIIAGIFSNGYLLGLHILFRDARCTLYILWVVGGLTFLTKWAAISWAFRPGGVAMGLLHDVVHRGEDLFDFHNSLRAHLWLGAASILAVCCSRFMSQVGSDLGCEVKPDKQLDAWQLSHYDVGCVAAQVAYYPLASVLVMLVWSTLWLVHTLCSLHVKELRWFAETVAETLEDDDGSQDILGDLNIVEGNITRRFIQASQGWVFLVVAGVSTVAVFWTLLVTMIISGNHHEQELVPLVTSLVLCTLLMGYSFLPLAKVAEVYEYDLLRTLNKPIVLHKAMPLLGQQMLPHLHTLEWGFKIGQTIINMRLVVNILGAIALTSVTTVGAAMMSSMSGE